MRKPTGRPEGHPAGKPLSPEHRAAISRGMRESSATKRAQRARRERERAERIDNNA